MKPFVQGSSVGVVCGMASEAQVLRRDARYAQWAIAVSGADAGRAANMARTLIGEGAKVLVSFGLSGALIPDHQPGDLLLSDEVALPDGTLLKSTGDHARRLEARAREAGIELHTARLAGADGIIATAEDKARLAQKTGGAAVDMESHAVARVAQETGVPFIAVRAIADPATRAIPKAALVGIAPDGSTRPLAVIGALMKSPGDVPGLIRLAQDSAKGERALGRAALHLLPALL